MTACFILLHGLVLLASYFSSQIEQEQDLSCLFLQKFTKPLSLDSTVLTGVYITLVLTRTNCLYETKGTTRDS